MKSLERVSYDIRTVSVVNEYNACAFAEQLWNIRIGRNLADVFAYVKFVIFCHVYGDNLVFVTVYIAYGLYCRYD